MLFSANLGVLFPNFPLKEKLQKAKLEGFNFVEIPDPYDYTPRTIAKRLCGTKCTLIDTFCEPGSFGHAAIPGEELEFCQSLNRTIVYYRELGFQKIHIKTGLRRPKFTFEDQFNKLYNMTALIEPVCEAENEDYFLSTFDTAVQVLEATTNKRAKLLLNIYHLHEIVGDIKENLPKYYPYAGHIRIAHAPGVVRSDGDIDYKFVFDFLKEKNHQDIISLQYFPESDFTTYI